jgi:predicted O-methyltransferase YrrM
MSLTSFLQQKGFRRFEGYSGQIKQQVDDLKLLVSTDTIVNAMEIGFNAGHSADNFLSSNNNLKLVSFDLGGHKYVTVAKEFIDSTYPGRHTLILGDSKKTVPEYAANSTNKFDFIFIDGGHDYLTAKSDVENCFKLAHENTIVVLDDTIFTKYWSVSFTKGPTKVWLENVKNNKLNEIGKKDYCRGRGMAWGKYVF